MPAQDPADSSHGLSTGLSAGLSTISPPARHPLRRAARALLDLVLPMSCVGCGREGSPLCERCEQDLPRLRRPHCSRCAEPDAPLLCRRCSETRPAFDRIHAPYLAGGAARELVHKLKYNDARAYSERIAGLLALFMEREGIDGDLLIPVPLHGSRERRRGYNQSALIARDLGRVTGIAVADRALRRVRQGVPQVTLLRASERREAVGGAFECAPVAPVTVLLVDDVVTTGATLSGCARALKNAGADRVLGLAFTRQSLGRRGRG